MTRPSRRRAGIAAGVLALALLALLVHQLAWIRSPEPWSEATGWDRIPADLRPPDAPPWPATDASGPPPEIGWLGHSGFVVRWHGAQLLLDPNASDRCTLTCRRLEPAQDVALLGPVDAVLVSHAHRDHFDLSTLERLASVGRVIVPIGAERYLEGQPVRAASIDGVEAGQCVPVGDLLACAVAAEHNGNRDHPFTSDIPALGYVIRAGEHGPSIYYAGDTGWRIDWDDLRERHHPRLAILPIGAWLPRIPMKYYHLSPEEAAEAAERLGSPVVVPCHFGTFWMSADEPSWALPRFARAARARGLAWRMPRLLSPAAAWSAP